MSNPCTAYIELLNNCSNISLRSYTKKVDIYLNKLKPYTLDEPIHCKKDLYKFYLIDFIFFIHIEGITLGYHQGLG